MFASRTRFFLLPLSDGLGGRQRALAFLALGAVGGLGHPPVGLPVLTLLSLLGVMGLAPWRLAPPVAAWAGWAYGFGYFAVTLHWIVEPFLVDVARHGWMAPFAMVFMAGGLALFWAAAFAAGGWRKSGLVFALALAGAEFARAHVFGGFPWGTHAVAGVGLWLYHGAAWLGPHGLGLALFIYMRAAVALPPSAAAPALLALAGLLIPVAPAPAPPPGDDAPLIRVVQPNARQDLKWREDMVRVFLERQLAATAALPPADLVIWPEVAVRPWLEAADGIFAEAARRGGGAELLIGAQSFRGGAAYNALAHISADGTRAATYDKHHLVPFGEYMPLGWLFSRLGVYGLAANDGFGFAAGPGPQVMEIPGIGRVQPLICYESIFPHEVGRGVVRPRLLAVVTNDAWFGQWGGPAQHLAQARARAIEQGLPVARSANTGISAIIDARGQIVEALPLGAAGHVDAVLPAARPPTLYARMGDSLFYVMALATLAAHLVAVQRKGD